MLPAARPAKPSAIRPTVDPTVSWLSGRHVSDNAWLIALCSAHEPDGRSPSRPRAVTVITRMFRLPRQPSCVRKHAHLSPERADSRLYRIPRDHHPLAAGRSACRTPPSAGHTWTASHIAVPIAALKTPAARLCGPIEFSTNQRNASGARDRLVGNGAGRFV